MAWKNATLQEKGCFVFQQNLTRVVACTERCSDKNVGALAKKLGLLWGKVFYLGKQDRFLAPFKLAKPAGTGTVLVTCERFCFFISYSSMEQDQMTQNATLFWHFKGHSAIFCLSCV